MQPQKVIKPRNTNEGLKDREKWRNAILYKVDIFLIGRIVGMVDEKFLSRQYKQLPKQTGDRSASEFMWELLSLRPINLGPNLNTS
jgi:hypothetical protein